MFNDFQQTIQNKTGNTFMDEVSQKCSHVTNHVSAFTLTELWYVEPLIKGDATLWMCNGLKNSRPNPAKVSFQMEKDTYLIFGP